MPQNPLFRRFVAVAAVAPLLLAGACAGEDALSGDSGDSGDSG